MPQKVQKLYVLVSDSLMQVSFAGFLSLPALYVVVCSLTLNITAVTVVSLAASDS
jgi:hypothetical protein